MIVLAPSSVQEFADMAAEAFDLADKYRNPVMILADGMLGQMKEPVVFPEPISDFPEKEWALKGRGDGPSRYMASLILDPMEMERHNWELVRKYQVIAKNETRYEEYMPPNPVIIKMTECLI